MDEKWAEVSSDYTVNVKCPKGTLEKLGLWDNKYILGHLSSAMGWNTKYKKFNVTQDRKTGETLFSYDKQPLLTFKDGEFKIPIPPKDSANAESRVAVTSRAVRAFLENSKEIGLSNVDLDKVEIGIGRPNASFIRLNSSRELRHLCESKANVLQSFSREKEMGKYSELANEIKNFNAKQEIIRLNETIPYEKRQEMQEDLSSKVKPKLNLAKVFPELTKKPPYKCAYELENVKNGISDYSVNRPVKLAEDLGKALGTKVYVTSLKDGTWDGTCRFYEKGNDLPLLEYTLSKGDKNNPKAEQKESYTLYLGNDEEKLLKVAETLINKTKDTRNTTTLSMLEGEKLKDGKRGEVLAGVLGVKAGLHDLLGQKAESERCRKKAANAAGLDLLGPAAKAGIRSEAKGSNFATLVSRTNDDLSKDDGTGGIIVNREACRPAIAVLMSKIKSGVNWLASALGVPPKDKRLSHTIDIINEYSKHKEVSSEGISITDKRLDTPLTKDTKPFEEIKDNLLTITGVTDNDVKRLKKAGLPVTASIHVGFLKKGDGVVNAYAVVMATPRPLDDGLRKEMVDQIRKDYLKDSANIAQLADTPNITLERFHEQTKTSKGTLQPAEAFRPSGYRMVKMDNLMKEVKQAHSHLEIIDNAKGVKPPDKPTPNKPARSARL